MEQFQIFSLFSLNLTLNNVIFYLIIASSLGIAINLAGTNPKGFIVSSWWFILSESLFRSISVMVHNYIGPKFSIFLPLIYSLFHLILFSNLVGLVPYSSTPTVEIIITISIALSLLLGILLFAFLSHHLFVFTAFIPAGTPLGILFLIFPLEILGYLTKTISLGLRLGINMITGHILVKVIIGFIWSAYLNGSSLVLLLPLLLLTLFLALELLIAYLQAYIFTFITCITLKDLL